MIKKNFYFFILILIANFNINISYANDVKEIELDGMSLGESLLKFTSENEIKKNEINYFDDERQYYVVFYNKNLSKFDDMEIYLKTNDKKYIMKSINAGIYPKNLKECLKIKDEYINEITSTLNLDFVDASYTHNYYTNSYINGDVAYLKGGFISLDCMFFDKKDKNKFPGLVDNLSVTLSLNEINDWIETGYK